MAVGSACNVYVTYRITTHLESVCYQVIIELEKGSLGKTAEIIVHENTE